MSAREWSREREQESGYPRFHRGQPHRNHSPEERYYGRGRDPSRVPLNGGVTGEWSVERLRRGIESEQVDGLRDGQRRGRSRVV